MKKTYNKYIIILSIVLLLSIGVGGYFIFNYFTEKKYDNNKIECEQCEECEECEYSIEENNIKNIVSKYSLEKIERFYAKFDYCYTGEEDNGNCNIRYYVPIAIEDEKLVLVDDVVIDYNEEQKTQFYDIENIFPVKPKKLLYLDSCAYSHCLTLYIIAANGDLYTLNTKHRGLESSRLDKKPNELTFSKVDIGKKKVVDFYFKDGDYKGQYYILTTTGNLFEINDIYNFTLGEELK